MFTMLIIFTIVTSMLTQMFETMHEIDVEISEIHNQLFYNLLKISTYCHFEQASLTELHLYNRLPL